MKKCISSTGPLDDRSLVVVVVVIVVGYRRRGGGRLEARGRGFIVVIIVVIITVVIITITATTAPTTTTRERSSRGPVDEMHFFKKSCSRLRPKLCNLPHYVNTWPSTCHNKPRKLHGFNTLCEHVPGYMSQ